MPYTHKQLDSLFGYHPPLTPETGVLHDTIRRTCNGLATFLLDYLPESEEKWEAIKKVREAMFWSNAAVAIHQHVPPPYEKVARASTTRASVTIPTPDRTLHLYDHNRRKLYVLSNTYDSFGLKIIGVRLHALDPGYNNSWLDKAEWEPVTEGTLIHAAWLQL